MPNEPSPGHFFETVLAFHRTAALKAAIELGVFTVLGRNAGTALTVARHCGASPRGVRSLCDYLTTLGFLTKSGDCYDLALDSKAFLVPGSPTYLGGVIEFLLSPPQTECFKDLTAAVREGRTALSGDGVSAREHDAWMRFAHAMSPVLRAPAELLATFLGADAGPSWRVLDIAAGHGIFGITIARRNPNAHVVALDWASVLQVAQENASAAGVADRYSLLAGDAFDVEYGSDFDLILLTNFLHIFDAAAIERLLAKVYVALKAGGRVLIVEFIPNPDRVSPLVAAQFSLWMLATTPGGDAYTFSEYDHMLKKVGFSRCELQEMAPTFFRLVLASK